MLSTYFRRSEKHCLIMTLLPRFKWLKMKRPTKLNVKRIVLSTCIAASLFIVFISTTLVLSGFTFFTKDILGPTSKHLTKSNQELYAWNKSRIVSIEDIYGESWNRVITPYIAHFIIDGRDICSAGPPPMLLIFVLSLPKNLAERQAIRQTWGSVTKKNNDALKLSARLVFMLGIMRDIPDKLLKDESVNNKDIVQIDFIESRYNLTKKMMFGLRWIKMYCPSVNYILKADDDTFINIDRFSNYFLRESNINNRTIYGYLYPKGLNIAREGRYAVTKKELPISVYPPYLSGTAYILPFDVITDMLRLAERLPYCPVDDAFITGVLRVILNINIQHSKDFTDAMEVKFDACKFFSKIAVTNIDARCMNMLWNLTRAGEIVCKQSELFDKNICTIFG